FNPDAVALHLQPHLPVHAQLRLCGDGFMGDRGCGGHPEFCAVPHRPRSEIVMTDTPMPLVGNAKPIAAKAGWRTPTNPLAVARRGPVYLLLSVAAFISVFPFFWMIVGATNSSADIVKGKANFASELFNNAATFFAQVDAPRIFFNSAFIAIVGTVL